MTTLRADAAKACDEAAIKLAHVRGCSKVDAAKAVAQTYSANLALSRDTTMEAYWRLMVDVADQLVGDMLRESA